MRIKYGFEWLTFLVLAHIAWAVQPAWSAERPKIGIALGGGAAKGFAHVGILKWLEDHRIPVDYVAGTSMGGLVGGAYATGMSPSEIAELLRGVDYDLLFLGDAPYELKEFRRKEDARDFPTRLEVGLKNGIKLPGGLDPGHQIGLLLSRIALPYSTVDDFGELPIPFRCVAVDMETADTVTMADGSLAQALRATMAIPGVFTPVLRDDRVLADGGLVNNVPADVARSMGADIVIAVDVGSKMKGKGQLTSLVDNASQAIDVMMRSHTRIALETADLVISPDLGKYTSSDYRASNALADLGYQAAAAHAGDLERWSLGKEEWQRYLEERKARTRNGDLTPEFLTVEGVSDKLERQIERSLRNHLNRPIDIPKLERDLTAITGLKRVESIRYEAADKDGTHGLKVVGTETAHGPPFIKFSLGLINEPDNIDFNFGSRFTALDVGGDGAEVRADVYLGSTTGVEFEYYRPFFRRLFVAPRGTFVQKTENVYDDDELLSRERRRRLAIGADLGVSSGRRSELRLGYTVAESSSEVRVGSPTIPGANGREQRVRLRWIFDGQDQPVVPTRGLRTNLIVDGFLEAPEAERTFWQSRFTLSAYWPLSQRDRLVFAGLAGHTYDEPIPSLYNFTLGGPQRLSAFNNEEFRGKNALLGQVGYLRTIGRLPDFVGGPIYALGLAEVGSAYDDFDLAEFNFSGSAGLLLDTSLGPLFVGLAVGDDGSGRFYFMLGRFIR
jgi:NTE family protein